MISLIGATPAVLVSGLVLGSLYALMATGLSLVWSTLGVFNFTHGVFMTLGAYVAWQIGAAEGWNLGLAIGAAVAVSVLIGLGIIVEQALVRPFLGHHNQMLVVITTLAGMTIIQNGVLVLWGPRFKQLPPLAAGTVDILGVGISAHEALIIVVAPALLVGLWLFLMRTDLGTAVRAVGQNPEAATLMGHRVSVIYAITFGLSAALSAVAGILLGAIRFITPDMGSEPLVKALIVAIFGGLGSVAGTIGGAYVIGIVEAISTYLVGLYWTPAVLFALMIAVLVFRPFGLFGARE